MTMTTFAIGDHSASTTEESILPLPLGDYNNEGLSLDQNPIQYDSGGLLDEEYGNFDTTNSSMKTVLQTESDVDSANGETVKPKEIKDFNVLSEFAGKLVNEQKVEPIEAQEVTYNKFWDLF